MNLGEAEAEGLAVGGFQIGCGLFEFLEERVRAGVEKLPGDFFAELVSVSADQFGRRRAESITDDCSQRTAERACDSGSEAGGGDANGGGC